MYRDVTGPKKVADKTLKINGGAVINSLTTRNDIMSKNHKIRVT